MQLSKNMFIAFLCLAVLIISGCGGNSGGSSGGNSGGSSSPTSSTITSVTAPTFSVAAGTYPSAQTVAISDPTSGATIYYSTDGTAPTTSSTVYTKALTVATTENLQAIAAASGYSTSSVASALYTITPPAATPAFSVEPGTYTTPQTVSISDSSAGTAIYYTTDGTIPTTSSSLYSSPIRVSSTETLQAIASGGTYSASTVASATYTITPLSSLYWKAPKVGSVNSLGTVTLPTGGGETTTILNPKVTGNFDNLVCTGASWDTNGELLTVTYTETTAVVHVTVQLAQTAHGFSAMIAADQPLISSLDMQSWNPDLSAIPLPVPYYSGNVWHAQAISQFINGWWDWKHSNASKLDGTRADYFQKTDGSLNPLGEVLEFVASSNVDDVFPYPENNPSPYLATLAGSMVLDIEDAGFSTIQQSFKNWNQYGVTNCLGIIHNWQYTGYDNALPEHFPANPTLGGNDGLKAAIAEGISNGCLMGVHENYIDYYPNYPLFNSAAIALNSDGSRMDGWLNPSTGIQSFSSKPSWLIPNAQTQSPIIHSTFSTNTGFQDVLSSAPIYWRQDYDAAAEGPAKFITAMNAFRSLWAYERRVHGGPIIGEGGNHWYYSGLLDSAEARLGAGSVPANSDVSAPLFVDFDVLRIHPLEINHGMGNYEHWTKDQTGNMSTTQLDAYRMQELAFGHGPFLGASSWENLPIAFTESNLAVPVTSSYGTSQAAEIKYGVNGAWISPSEAAVSGQYSQVQVNYENGTTVVANSASAPLSWNDLTIPQYGWAATGRNLKAYTAECGTIVCDYSQTSTTYFANSRNQEDFQAGGGYAVPSVKSLVQGSGKSFVIIYNWLVHLSLGNQTAYMAFVHFVNDAQVTPTDPAIVFGADHTLAPATTDWIPGQAIADGPRTIDIPSSVPDGTYSIRVGLYDPTTGVRLPLSGNNDGTNRYIVGYLTISGGGTKAGFSAPQPPAPDPRLNFAGTVVDFGTIQTDGMVSITQQNGNWILRTYPFYRNVIVNLSAANFPEPSSVQAAGGTSSTVTPTSKGSYWALPTNGAHYYTWPVN